MSTDLPAAPFTRPMPPVVRGVAWMVYLMTLGILAWIGAQLAFQQVPPQDPALDGPIPPKTEVANGVLPGNYPLAIEQKELRDYLFTVAAGKDASEFLKNGKIRLLGSPASEAKTPEAPGISTGSEQSITVLSYDGDLVRWRLPNAAGPLWGPKKPLEDAIKAQR